MEDSSSNSEDYEIIETLDSSLASSNMESQSCIEEPDLDNKQSDANLDKPNIETIPTTRLTSAKACEPQLNIANNGNLEDLQNQLHEVMKEKSSSPSPTNSDSGKEVKRAQRSSAQNEKYIYKEPLVRSATGEDNPNYCNKPSTGQEVKSVKVGDYTIFNQILYLGAASINAPRSELEIQKNMRILNSQTMAQPIEVSVSIPFTSDGFVIVYDATTESEMVRFKIHRIIFCARGQAGTSEARCFAFTCSHGESEQTFIFQCHVFQCQIPEAVARVLVTFVSAFHRVPPGSLDLAKTAENGQSEFHFDISLEIKEDDGKGNFNVVPRDKECFKLRCNIEKQVTLTVTPSPTTNPIHSTMDVLSSNGLIIERCFGLLIAHGRKVKHADMNLLDMVPLGNNTSDRYSYSVCGVWDPKDPLFAALNEDTKDMRVFMTVALDLVIRGIQEPVRFVIETKVRIFPQNERFWYYSKRSMTHLFSLKIKQAETSPQGDPQFVVVSVDNLGEVERMRPSTLSLSLNFSSLTTSTLSSFSVGRSESVASLETPGAEDDDDDDEPLLSGSGEVSKECAEGELEMWKQVLPKWQTNPTQPIPKGIVALVKRGVPEALRGEVWQLLAKSTNDTEMMETYRILITKECTCEQVIMRDINRTFPAHDFFKDSGGVGQDSLYKISRAYSVFDGEVSYCQGTSFLSAALLLHMPEEQAFCVLVKIMYDYGLRGLFMENFSLLHLRFYQLDRLMEEQLPELWCHFQELGIESHMFASQWFLTLYTAKFPLFMVFHYIDIFLLLGMDSVFQVAIALLQLSKKDLLGFDFEGVLKYFRVSLPKKYRSEQAVKQMFRLATSLKVKKLNKYEREYITIKQHELRIDPVIRLQRENHELLSEKIRLDRENDLLVNEFTHSKLGETIDKLEERCDNLTKEMSSLEALVNESEEEKSRLQQEAYQVKELLKREIEKGDVESQKTAAIILDYKQICSQLSSRLDKEQAASAKAISEYKVKVAGCDHCRQSLSPLSEASADEEDREEKLSQMAKELEMELAKTKLALVEAQCTNQELTHKLASAVNELQATKNTWLQKTITSISSLKERTTPSLPSGQFSTFSQPTSHHSSPPSAPLSRTMSTEPVAFTTSQPCHE